MPLQVTLGEYPAAKSLGHALKHSLKVVIGVLIGSHEKDAWTITDAVPMSHNLFVGAPITVSLAMIEEYCKLMGVEGDGESTIMGLYFFPVPDVNNEGAKNCLEHATLRTLAAAISKAQGHCLVLKGDVGSLSWSAVALPANQTEWTETDVATATVSSAVRESLVSHTIKEQGYLQVFDVEEFLTESSLCPV